MTQNGQTMSLQMSIFMRLSIPLTVQLFRRVLAVTIRRADAGSGCMTRLRPIRPAPPPRARLTYSCTAVFCAMPAPDSPVPDSPRARQARHDMARAPTQP